jgi:hypothetical protein
MMRLLIRSIAVAWTSIAILALFPATVQEEVVFTKSHLFMANIRLISSGMKRMDVLKLLRVPPGDYRVRHDVLLIDPYAGGLLMTNCLLEEWYTDDGLLLIGFSGEGTVQFVKFRRVP